MSDSQFQLLLGRPEGAKALGICMRKLDYLIAEKKLEVIRIGRRVLIPRKSLEQLARTGAK